MRRAFIDAARAKGLCLECCSKPAAAAGRSYCFRCERLRKRRASSLRARERSWATQGIALADGSPLTMAVYGEVLAFQRGCCGICGKFFMADKGEQAADHDHATGLFRGVLCGGKRGCNLQWAPRFDHLALDELRSIMETSPVERSRRIIGYLLATPYKRWLVARGHPGVILELPPRPTEPPEDGDAA